MEGSAELDGELVEGGSEGGDERGGGILHLAADVPLPRDYIYFEHTGNRAIRMGDWKLVAKGKDSWSLYDLGADRCERVDLAGRETARVRELSERWEALRQAFRNMAGATAGKGRKPGRGKR